MRNDGRKADETREVKITRDYLKYAEGSVLIEVGDTCVICSATVEEKIPNWMRGEHRGWVTAEYSLLPRSTQHRNIREAARGRISGRTYEIQRLIGRALRAVVDLEALGERTIWIDCDVLQADGGTRTAAITGAFVALADALQYLQREGKIDSWPLKDYVAGVSVGLIEQEALLDLSFEEDSSAEVDMNVVMTGRGEMIEVQGTAEKKPFSREQLQKLLELGEKGITELVGLQQEVLEEAPRHHHQAVPVPRKKLLLATGNEGKVRELRDMLSSLPLDILSLQDYPGLPEVEETGRTFKENAVLKAETIANLTGEMVMADDSGLEVEYLEGRPGVYSARFAGEKATDEENNALLLELMKDVPPQERAARFVCVIALSSPDGGTITVEGDCPGYLGSEPRGERGFGYDPLFICAEEGKTFGEMDHEEKSRVSHRGKALQRIRELLKNM